MHDTEGRVAASATRPRLSFAAAAVNYGRTLRYGNR